MRTEDGQDLPLRGEFEIDPHTGTVLQSELLLKTFDESVVLRTRYVFNDRLQVHIPSEMTETHLMRNGGKLESVAHYGRFHTFTVSTSEAFKYSACLCRQLRDIYVDDYCEADMIVGPFDTLRRETRRKPA